jgi:hypothetical protein
VGGALAPSRRGGVGPDFWSERPSRVKDTTTSGLLTSGLAAPGAGAGGRLERSLIRVSSAVGQCETVTAEVAPRPLGSEDPLQEPTLNLVITPVSSDLSLSWLKNLPKIQQQKFQ